jgi:hypothetical protein
MRRIGLKDALGSESLVGRSMAIEHFPKLVALAFGGDKDETIIWDFGDVDLATASYIGGTFVPLIRMVTSGKLARYFVFANLNEHCQDELSLVFEAEKLAALCLQEKEEGHGGDSKIIGHLDPAYRDTLATVLAKGRVSAAMLQGGKERQDKVKRTTRIKRLTTLVSQGLLRRMKVGREYVYEATYN